MPFQIRYPRNGDFAQRLQSHFTDSYEYFKQQRQGRSSTDRSMVRLPDDLKEFIAIYTTQSENSYVIETINANEISLFKDTMKDHAEQNVEQDINYDVKDTSATIFNNERLIKIRKLNRKISENLKLLYGYRCQICGLYIGEEYQAHVVESHHIDYFIQSFNNDSENQLIVCPNHHKIIHYTNPIFDRKRLLYVYPNGFQESLKINKHIKLTV